MPLIPQGGSIPAAPHAEFRVAILPQAENAQPLRPAGQSAAAPSPSGSCAVGEPRVTVQRDGDRISSIQVQCACGQIIQLACIYETSAGGR